MATEKSQPVIEESPPATATGFLLLVFNTRNHLGLLDCGSGFQPYRQKLDTPCETGSDLEKQVQSSLEQWGINGVPYFQFVTELPGEEQCHAVYFVKTEEVASLAYITLEKLVARLKAEPQYSPGWFRSLLPEIRKYSIELPYLEFKRHDFVYKFRNRSERNPSVYQKDDSSRVLYQSRLCEAIKATRRTHENASTHPALLDFGPVHYYLPSHFGFCLGVQNAIERAYETLAENPDNRVFMLSELIHNPYVNEDLLARGLRFLQTDKGEPVIDEDTGKPYWELLDEEDIVIIPAFGATLEDKRRLIEKGLEINRYDATCMLVEKVWKAAKRFAESGFTIIIHGKGEHEETKATFSSSSRYAPCLIIRNLSEAKQVGSIIQAKDPDEKCRLFRNLSLRSSPGFDPVEDLKKIAVVNQTTLLRNETLGIIRYFESVMGTVYGEDAVEEHLNGKSKGDTLCYATQVNQDALNRTLEEKIDYAIVAGGKNSSNTYQLFRICNEQFGERAYYIQSEDNILHESEIEHYHFPYNPEDPKAGTVERRPFLSKPTMEKGPVRILLTGGASCPDGIIQQIITRINGFFDPDKLRSIEDVIRDMEST